MTGLPHGSLAMLRRGVPDVRQGGHDEPAS
jgi:hypothetical protein